MSRTPLAHEPVLGLRALNRATLQRQLLLQRSPLGVVAAVEHLAGLQHQSPNAPYFALFARLARFDRASLTRLLVQRRLVRCALMRGTLHLCSARDLLAFRPVLQSVQMRALQASRGRALQGLDLDRVAGEGHRLLCAEPLNSGQLGQRLARAHAGRDAASLAMAVRAREALVHVPPAGTWDVFQSAWLLPAEAWLGRQQATDVQPDAMLLRYLAAFGPATAQDIATWSGLAGVAEPLERLQPRLRRFRDEQGRLLYDLRRASLPDPATPAPVRLVGEFDNLVLSHADRRRLLADAHRSEVVTVNGQIRACVLVDGFVRGTWKIERSGAQARLVVTPFERIATADREAVTVEARRMLSFAADDAGTHHVRFARPGQG